MKILLLIIFLIWAVGAQAWTKREQGLYTQRRFIELIHLSIMKNKISLKDKLLKQEQDLKGCKMMEEGHGGLESLIKCVSFLNRENDIKLFTPGRGKVISDINILCGKILPQGGSVSKVIENKGFFDHVLWGPCIDTVWQQVYLTVYANFDADPLGALALFRKASTNLNRQSSWYKKTLDLIKGNSKN